MKKSTDFKTILDLAQQLLQTAQILLFGHKYCAEILQSFKYQKSSG